jgi:hypothetical protein
MNNQVSLSGDALLALVCPYYPTSAKITYGLEILTEAGTIIQYSPRDMEEIINYLDNEVRPAAAGIDTFPVHDSGVSPSQIEVARGVCSPLLRMYLGYTSFDAFRDAVKNAPQRLGLIEAEVLN